MSDQDRAADTATDDDQFLVLAFYIVIDVSWSMQDNGGIVEANGIIPALLDAITENPTLCDLVRIGVIDFSDDAQVVIPLGDLRAVQHIPQLQARGGTSYAAAFRRLRRDIESDMAQLKSDGFKVYRPVVFLITDGAPTDSPDDLQTAFAEITAPDFRARPNIVPFGVAAATKENLDMWVHPQGRMRSFVAKDGVDPKTALARLTEVILGSILASASSVSESGSSGGFVLPDDEDLGVFI